MIKLKPYEAKPMFLKSQEYKNLSSNNIQKLEGASRKQKGSLVTNSTEYFTFNRRRKIDEPFSPSVKEEQKKLESLDLHKKNQSEFLPSQNYSFHEDQAPDKGALAIAELEDDDSCNISNASLKEEEANKKIFEDSVSQKSK